jgi:hypothetical protein
MITFFGIWILLFSLLILIFSIIKKQLIPNNNKPLYFLCAWIISELPLWFVLPEHAIRYTSALIVPITLIGGILVSYALSCVHVSLKKYYVPLMMFLFIGICITHVGYSLAYRIGWGSSFIAMDTAAYYLAAYDPDAHATYYALSAGDEYLILTKEKGNYSISTTPRFIKTTDVTAFDNLIASKDSQAYILQRITPQGTAFPPLSLQQQNLQEIIRIKGTSTNGFDYLYLKICSWFKKTPLTSEVAIYHINEKKIQQK